MSFKSSPRSVEAAHRHQLADPTVAEQPLNGKAACEATVEPTTGAVVTSTTFFRGVSWLAVDPETDCRSFDRVARSLLPTSENGRKHMTLKETPAMASGLADHVWTIRELIEESAKH